MLIDLHSHSTISDGALAPREVVAAAGRRGYDVFALTDHGTPSNFREVAERVREEVEALRASASVHLLAGVELTELEPSTIAHAAREARRCGAQVIVVHGECVTMQTPAGTNAAAVRCDLVDVLAHPGLVTAEDAGIAARNDVCLELSARGGHSYGNGWVYHTATAADALLVVDSDGHDETGLLSTQKVEAIVRGAGAGPSEMRFITGPMASSVLRIVTARMSVV